MVSHAFKILLLILVTSVIAKKKKLGPHWDHRERTTCQEFERYARFNPYTMPNETWFLFYYWSPMPDSFYFHFEVPTKKNYTDLQKTLDGQVTVPVNWTAKHVIMRTGRELYLLVEQGDRGQYLMYNLMMAQVLSARGKVTPVEVRLKQTGDNKIVGLMNCRKDTMFALVRFNDLPRQNLLQETAARLNYRSRGGKSYLYQDSTTWYPHATIRMKMVDQYLAMMFCEEHLAMMLAVVGEEPDPSESAAEAAKLGFHGIGAPVTKQGQAAPAVDDRREDFDEKMNLDRHSQVVKSFYTP